MKLAKLFFFLALPSIIWNAPLQSSEPHQPYSLYPKNEYYFTFDEIMALVESFENGTLENFCSRQELDSITDFIIQLARCGTSIDLIDAQLLEYDINELSFSEEDLCYFYSYSSNKLPQILPAIPHKHYEIIPCRSFKKRWKSCKKFLESL